MRAHGEVAEVLPPMCDGVHAARWDGAVAFSRDVIAWQRNRAVA